MEIGPSQADKDAENFSTVIELLKEYGKFGFFQKDKYKSPFIESWDAAVTENGLEKVSLS